MLTNNIRRLDMKYLPPVINEVKNKLNTHLTFKLNYNRYPIAANATTRIEFDVMSRAAGPEREDIMGAVEAGYIEVDVLVLKDGKYEKVGSYEACTSVVKAPVVVAAKPAPKASEIAEKMGIKVADVEAPEKSVNKVETEEKPALDPIKAINNPRVRRAAKVEAPKPVEAPVQEVKPAEEAPVLDTVKNNEDAE
jgi:hypothetical protein